MLGTSSDRDGARDNSSETDMVFHVLIFGVVLIEKHFNWE